MERKNILHLSAMLLAASLFYACAPKPTPLPPAPVTHVVYSPGENLTALTKVHETDYACGFPFGGDNGKNLFFTVADNANLNYTNIYRKDVPTNMSLIQLTGGNSRNEAPSYCAVTNQVAFAGRPEGNSIYDIYIVNASKGGALTQVTNTPDYHEQYPNISRDGKKIVYERRLRSANSKNTELWVKNMQTNETMQIGLGRTPSFSPDGKSIVFVKYANDSYTTCLCVVNSDGSNLRIITDASLGSVWRPCFSPNGKQIVFQCRKPQKGDDDLYIIGVDGTGLTQLTINKSFDGEPYWANDGYIYFTSDRGGIDRHYQIWRFSYGKQTDIETTTVTQPTRTSTSPSVPEYRYHTVSAGETITDIAKRYGITVRDIIKWNGLTTMTITAGMRLKVSQ
ncbi:MAG: LysM peptidoglycan-binding domain-containing protein [Prevotella sp.]|nr:LysM peptidoglycan-binding domain-containing protein [Prevotella sp.]